MYAGGIWYHNLGLQIHDRVVLYNARQKVYTCWWKSDIIKPGLRVRILRPRLIDYCTSNTSYIPIVVS